MRRPLALACVLGLASCDAVVGVDWDSYREATPKPLERCAGGCATAALLVEDPAVDLAVQSAAGTTDGGLVVASSTWIAKLCAGGDRVWSTSITDAEVYDVAPDPDGGAYVVGAFEGTLAGLDAGGERKGFLVRYGFDGKVVTARMFDGPIVAVATTTSSSSHPVAVTALRPAGRALFTEGACGEVGETTSGELAVLRLDASGACLNRADCADLDPAVHGSNARPATDLAFDGQGALVFAGPYDGVPGGANTCGSVSAPPVGTRGLVLARASTTSGFDDWGAHRFEGWVDPPGSQLFVAVHPSTGAVYLSGTTSAKFDFGSSDLGAPNGNASMWIARTAPVGNPNHVYRVGPDTLGPSRGGGIAFDAEGSAVVAGVVDGSVSWQGGVTLEGGANGARLVLTRIDASEAEPPSFLDPGNSQVVAPLLVARSDAAGVGCGVSLVTAFDGSIDLASGPALAKGTTLLVAPGVGPAFFASK